MARHATNPLTGRPLCGSMGAPHHGLTCRTCRRLLSAVSTRNAEYQSWCESEAEESLMDRFASWLAIVGLGLCALTLAYSLLLAIARVT